MSANLPVLQEPFLNKLRSERIPMSLFLSNGIRLQGIVEAFDPYVILLRHNGHTQMIYKHAISTIVPGRDVSVPSIEPSTA